MQISANDAAKIKAILKNYRAEYLKHEEKRKQYAATRIARYATNFTITVFTVLLFLFAHYAIEKIRIDTEKARSEAEHWERILNSERFRRDIIAIARKNDFDTHAPQKFIFDGAKVYAYYHWFAWILDYPTMLFCSDGIRRGESYPDKDNEGKYKYHDIDFVPYSDLSKARNDDKLRRKIQKIFSEFPDQDDVQSAIRDLMNLDYESYY